MLSYDPKGHVISYRSSVATGRTKIFIKESEKTYMKNKVYLIWLINDDVDPMVVGIATSEDKANSMRDKLASTDGFEFNDYEIIEMNADTVIIDDVEYRF